MSEDTQRRVGKLYREGIWNKEDAQAEAWADEFYPVEEPKKEVEVIKSTKKK